MSALILVVSALSVGIIYLLITGTYERVAGLTILSSAALGITVLVALKTEWKQFRSNVIREKVAVIYLVWCILCFGFGILFFGFGLRTLTELAFFTSLGVLYLLPLNCKKIKLFDHLIACMLVVGLISTLYFILRGGFDLYRYQGRFELATSQPTVALGFMATAPYLALKYARSFNYLFLIGLISLVLRGSVLASTGSRKELLFLALALVLIFLILIKTKGKNRNRAYFLAIPTLLVTIVYGIHKYQAGELDFRLVMARLEKLLDEEQKGGGIFNDPRYLEFYLNQNTFINPRIVLGYGFGSFWIDRVMYNNPYRTIFHLNVLHYPFKIGLIGTALFLLMLYKRASSIRQLDLAYIAFASIWFMNFLVYGAKALEPVQMLLYFILVNPVLFRIGLDDRNVLRDNRIA